MPRGPSGTPSLAQVVTAAGGLHLRVRCLALHTAWKRHVEKALRRQSQKGSGKHPLVPSLLEPTTHMEH